MNTTYDETPNSHSSGSDALDALFRSARDSEPVLRDENFSKMVLNSLPANPQRHLLANRASRSGISFDLIGLFVGVLCAYMFVEMRTILSFVLSFIPESVVISPALLIAALAATVLLSLGAWWTVEHGSRA